MKLFRVGPHGQERPCVMGPDGRVLDLSALTADIDGAFLAGGGVERVRSALAEGSLPEAGPYERIGAPVARPGKIVCIGLNYHDHAEETGAAVPAEPVVFMKAPDTVVGPDDEVLVPRGSVKTDWEVELGVVIGAHGPLPRLARGRGSASIAGYAVAHDVSEREFQIERGGQWDKGKNCETFNPLGPWLVTADEVADPQALGLRLWVNGELRQNGSTAEHDLRRAPRRLVPQPVHGAATRATSSTPAPRRAWPSGMPGQAVPARRRRGRARDRRPRPPAPADGAGVRADETLPGRAGARPGIPAAMDARSPA